VTFRLRDLRSTGTTSGRPGNRHAYTIYFAAQPGRHQLVVAGGQLGVQILPKMEPAGDRSSCLSS
jgi:hypothetical protein